MSKDPMRDINFNKAVSYNGDDCFIWPFGSSGDGYAMLSGGRFKRKYGTNMVARAVCIEVYGPPPTDKHQAAHSCGNGHLGCINRKHLRWATQEDNFADDRIGEDHPQSKLTEEQVLEIRQLNGTMTHQQIAYVYGISQPHVSAIMRQEYWAWLANPNFRYNGPNLFA